MASVGQERATLDDLYRTPGKAELIGGRIVEFMATGRKPNRVAGNIYLSLRSQERRLGGETFTDNIGFAVPELPNGRESFSPDVAFSRGPFPENPMRFIEGAPAFAVEVRSENDYGRAAEEEMAAKRADYFLAGTLVVWDVDPVDELVHVFRFEDPTNSVSYRQGDIAEAEPALPGWRPSVSEIFA